jgi:endonuclease I
MKPLLLWGSLFILGFFHAQTNIPEGYYDNATGTGYALKTQLKTIITNNHSPISYGGLWELYKNAPDAFNDNWYEKDGSTTLLDIYSEIPNGKDDYNYTAGIEQCGSESYSQEGKCYNREHLIPQSVFNGDMPMYSDAFHIWPTDGVVNGRRSNHPFGKVGNATWSSRNGSKLGANNNSGYSQGYSGTVFEPINEFKGDIARAYFYFATRYEDQVNSWNYDMFNNTKNQVFTDTFKNILLTWNTIDPVSEREIALNEAIYAAQGNRNPYIDHPEWIEAIWGTSMGTDDFEYQLRDFLTIYPTLSSGVVYIKSEDEKAKIRKVLIFSMNGVLLQTVDNPLTTDKLEVRLDNPGVYIIKAVGNDFEVNRKVIVK